MKIIFTGIHNKPNKTPLDSTTRTGKLVDEIIAAVHKRYPKTTCVKSNFFAADKLPVRASYNIFMCSLSWKIRTRYNPKEDLVIGLGKATQKCFDVTFVKHLKFAHPASVRSALAREWYVQQVAEAIVFIIKAQTKPHVERK